LTPEGIRPAPYPSGAVQTAFKVIVIGGGHAGVEAAWAAANLIGETGSVALVTLNASKIGVMSCNPAIGGLAKGQIVREIDALGGVMGLATDATGIQFKVLNTSKGAAVHGPRAQCDKHAYARVVQGMIGARREIVVIGGAVERLIVEAGVIRGVEISVWAGAGGAGTNVGERAGERVILGAGAVVLTTGTFMRGLMHTGESKTPGGRFGESPAVGISAALSGLGFELGRLKTGTPPRLKRGSIAWESLEEQRGDAVPAAFSDLSGLAGLGSASGESKLEAGAAEASCAAGAGSLAKFPVLEQVDCRLTATNAAAHELIRANIHRAPMYSGQIESVGPRYCPSIEDKVVKFAERTSHHVYLEPESLSDDWIYCNGISTSLPADVQDGIVRSMAGCERAEIYRYGYAVEYDMVRPHQISASGMTRLVHGLFLAGQINGTSGYEEAAAQGIIAGINAARLVAGQEAITLGRDEAYIGVLMDDLVTKTPVEPYRMFTSRAEHRLSLRADNAADRLTPIAERLGLLATTDLGRMRSRVFAARREQMAAVTMRVHGARVEGRPLADIVRRPEFGAGDFAAAVGTINGETPDAGVMMTVQTDFFYSHYSRKAQGALASAADLDRRSIPASFDFAAIASIRTEARHALIRFRPQTLGQASRLEALTPADVTLLSVLIKKHRAGQADDANGLSRD